MPTCSQAASSRLARCEQYLTQLFSQVLVAAVRIWLLLQACSAGLQNGQECSPVVRGGAGMRAFQGTCSHVTPPQEDLHIRNAVTHRVQQEPSPCGFCVVHSGWDGEQHGATWTPSPQRLVV